MLGSVEEIAGYLLQRTWTLVRFDSPCLFTAENPVVHINPRGDTAGFGVLPAERMYMPVSPTHALVLSHPWTSWPERCVNGTVELARRLNWAMLNYPTNEHLLMHPDVAAHPLPTVGTLAAAPDLWWPWGEDPESEPPRSCRSRRGRSGPTRIGCLVGLDPPARARLIRGRRIGAVHAVAARQRCLHQQPEQRAANQNRPRRGRRPSSQRHGSYKRTRAGVLRPA